MIIRSMTIHIRKWMKTISNSIRRKATRVIFLVIDSPTLRARLAKLQLLLL
jgi:acyl-CoA hydrolase